MALKDKMNSTKPAVVVDELPGDVKKYAADLGHVPSPNELQRQFRIGYGRASVLVDMIIAEGLRAPADVATAVVDAEIVDTTEVVKVLTLKDKDGKPLYNPGGDVKPLKVKHKENEEAERTAANVALEAVDKMVSELTQVESGLEHSYAHLASLLVEVSNKEYYRFLDLPSMAKYIENISNKYGKGRTQLFGYVSTAKALLPYVTGDDLNTIGISKAKELTKAIKVTQKPPTDDVLKAAVDPKVTVKDLLKILGDQVRIPSIEKGTWYDKLAQGFYATKEEQDCLDAAFAKAMRIANLAEGTPDHIKRKTFLYMAAQEFANVPETSQE